MLARPDGEAPSRHWGDQWHFALARIANAARAYGKRPIDGPFTNYGDPEGFRASCLRARSLGFEGKWAIHPSQVAICNEVFSPSATQVGWAMGIIGKLEAEAARGGGALGLDGVLIDQAHVKLAQKILRRADLVSGHTREMVH